MMGLRKTMLDAKGNGPADAGDEQPPRVHFPAPTANRPPLRRTLNQNLSGIVKSDGRGPAEGETVYCAGGVDMRNASRLAISSWV